MKRLLPAILIFSIVGCVTLNKSSRKKLPVVAEVREVDNKSRINIPQIRKPRIINWKGKMKTKEKDENINVSEQIEEIVKEDTTPELNENLNEAERNKRFNNLIVEENLSNKEDQIKEEQPTKLDTIVVWIGTIGVLSVFWTGVYFIARNLF
jgi:hypothetical protein